MDFTRRPQPPLYLDTSDIASEHTEAWHTLMALYDKTETAEREYSTAVGQCGENSVEAYTAKLAMYKAHMLLLDGLQTYIPIDAKAERAYRHCCRKAVDEFICRLSDELQSKSFGFDPNIGGPTEAKVWRAKLADLVEYYHTESRELLRGYAGGYHLPITGDQYPRIRAKYEQAMEVLTTRIGKMSICA